MTDERASIHDFPANEAPSVFEARGQSVIFDADLGGGRPLEITDCDVKFAPRRFSTSSLCLHRTWRGHGGDRLGGVEGLLATLKDLERS